MFKLFVLFALVAVAYATPGLIGAPVAAPLAYAAPAVAAAPLAYAAHGYAAAPLAYAAPAVAAAPLAYAAHGYAAPLAYKNAIIG